MNEIRTLMETIAKIHEADLPQDIGHGSGNATVVYAYDEDNIYGHGRSLEAIGQPGSLDTWYKVMNAALGWNDNEYNDFNADNVYQILKRFGEPAPKGEGGYDRYDYSAGREYSPVMYIAWSGGRSDEDKTVMLQSFEAFIRDNQQELRVSEINIYPNTEFSNIPQLRLWWD